MLRDIRITAVLNGFIVTVGCQTLAYSNTTEMLGDLGDYLRDPEATERRLLIDKGFNRKHTMGISHETATPSAMEPQDGGQLREAMCVGQANNGGNCGG